MNSGFTSERVYTALKERLLGGEFRPGERLDPAVLSDTLSSSVTPVRDVLNILVGEGLVETRTGEGFFRPHVTAPDLEDLYTWAEQTLTLTLRCWRARPSPAQSRGDGNTALADRAGALFLDIGARSANAEHRRAIGAINDRLHAVRAIEERQFDDAALELDRIQRAVDADDKREVSRLMARYHRRRRRGASELVRSIYRDS